MKCQNCGAEVNGKFCGNCGTKMETLDSQVREIAEKETDDERKVELANDEVVLRNYDLDPYFPVPYICIPINEIREIAFYPGTNHPGAYITPIFVQVRTDNVVWAEDASNLQPNLVDNCIWFFNFEAEKRIRQRAEEIAEKIGVPFVIIPTPEDLF